MARRVAPEAPVVAPFDLLEQYDLLEEIGGGERARVYRARDRVLDHAVAVKLLRDRYGRDAALAAHLYLTARAAASLGHPNIVTVFDQGQHDGSAFITMELVEGQSDIFEYYHPDTGAAPPKAAPIFGWSAACYIDLAIRVSRNEI